MLSPRAYGHCNPLALVLGIRVTLACANVEGRFSVTRNRFNRLAREGRCQDSRLDAVS